MKTLLTEAHLTQIWRRLLAKFGAGDAAIRFFPAASYRERVAQQVAIRAKHGKPAKRRR